MTLQLNLSGEQADALHVLLTDLARQEDTLTHAELNLLLPLRKYLYRPDFSAGKKFNSRQEEWLDLLKYEGEICLEGALSRMKDRHPDIPRADLRADLLPLMSTRMVDMDLDDNGYSCIWEVWK